MSRPLWIAGTTLLAVVGASVALAEDFVWPDGFHVAMTERFAEIDMDAFNEAEIYGLAEMRLGSIELVFGRTLLPDLAIKLGGTTRDIESGNDQLMQLCYVLENSSVLWLLSERYSHGRLDAISREFGPVQDDWDCFVTDLSFVMDGLDLGASIKDVYTLYGEDAHGDPEFIYYEDPQTPVARAAVFSARNDRLVAFTMLEYVY